MANCTHPTGIPIFDCCEEEAELPLYIQVFVRVCGYRWWRGIGGIGPENTQWAYFLRTTGTRTFNAAALAAGYVNVSGTKTWHNITNQYTLVGGDWETHLGQFWSQSTVSTGLPNPVDTTTWTYGAYSATDVTNYEVINPFSFYMQLARDIMAAADFSGLSARQPPLGTGNCKQILGDGTTTITWAGVGGHIIFSGWGWNTPNKNYQKSGAAFVYTSFVVPEDRADFVCLQRLRSLPGTYTEEKWVDEISFPATPGTRAYSRTVILPTTTVYEPPEYPTYATWDELSREALSDGISTYITLIPTAP